eukprot:GHVT01072632.1.p1 GENE.GHVT01072632.1~~GHVT01072632.1.p1  ORF type:complete len:368 (+),score=92.26 GHVT01072632.1:601-1704(+)
MEWANEEFVGALLVLVSTVLHALTFVINEKFLTSHDKPIDGPTLVYMMGLLNSSLLFGWMIVWTFPRWDVLIVRRMAEADGRVDHVVFLMLGIFACGLVHSATLWYILKTLGAVSTGVLKGVKTASVFVLSHIFFCPLQGPACFTPMKSVCAVVCVAGVTLYSVATARAGSAATEPQDRRRVEEEEDLEKILLLDGPPNLEEHLRESDAEPQQTENGKEHEHGKESGQEEKAEEEEDFCQEACALVVQECAEAGGSVEHRGAGGRFQEGAIAREDTWAMDAKERVESGWRSPRVKAKTNRPLEDLREEAQQLPACKGAEAKRRRQPADDAAGPPDSGRRRPGGSTPTAAAAARLRKTDGRHAHRRKV